MDAPEKKARGRPRGSTKKAREKKILAELQGMSLSQQSNASDSDSPSDSEISSIAKEFKTGMDNIKRNIDKELAKLEDQFSKAILDMRETMSELTVENGNLKTKCKSLEERISILEQKNLSHSSLINKNERFSRRNNIRLIGVKSTPNEDCLATTSKILKEVGGKDYKLERAHRDGRATPGKDRHILLKLTYYQEKVDIMKNARQALNGKPYYVIDDLTPSDLKEKRKWANRVKELYQAGTKLRFSGGFWRGSDGRPYVFE